MVKNQYSYRYYKCSTAHKAGKAACDQDNIRADKLEQIVYDAVRKHLNRWDRESILAEGKVQTQSLEKKLEDTNKDKNKYIGMQAKMTIQQDLYSEEAFTVTMLELRNKIEQCERQAHILQQQLSELQARDSNISSAEEYLAKMVDMDMNDLAPLRSLFHDLIERIDIRDKETISRIKYRFDF